MEVDSWKMFRFNISVRNRLVIGHLPRYQFKASDGVGASKYSMALLSTSLRATKIIRRELPSHACKAKARRFLTVSMNDASRLR